MAAFGSDARRFHASRTAADHDHLFPRFPGLFHDLRKNGFSSRRRIVDTVRLLFHTV